MEFDEKSERCTQHGLEDRLKVEEGIIVCKNSIDPSLVCPYLGPEAAHFTEIVSEGMFTAYEVDRCYRFCYASLEGDSS